LSGRESGRTPAGSHNGVSDPDTAEVALAVMREHLQGWVAAASSPEELRASLEQAFDYRGDVTITRKDGSEVEGYVFDRRTGTSLLDSYVRLLPKDGGRKLSICYDDIASLSFSGRDMAAGKSWENWVRSYWERKAAGESNISLQPEKLE